MAYATVYTDGGDSAGKRVVWWATLDSGDKMKILPDADVVYLIQNVLAEDQMAYHMVADSFDNEFDSEPTDGDQTENCNNTWQAHNLCWIEIENASSSDDIAVTVTGIRLE